MKSEQWKSIAGFEGSYEVSDYGRVRSLPRSVPYLSHGIWWTRSIPTRILKSHISAGRKYLHLPLHKDGKQTNHVVHRLVAQAFIPNPENKPQVNHIEQPKTNNSVGNLEWATTKEDGLHKATHGLMLKGSRHPHAKLNTKQVIEMRKLYAQGYTNVELTSLFNVGRTSVSSVVHRQGWKHVV